MRIHRLKVKDFAAIREVDIELGPGLNVLYGPNDLGKSTLAEAIRLALLLPHTSSHVDEYVPWSGGQSPVIELVFETEPQRIWRVRKEFRKGGGSVLEESKNGVDFDEVERARKVDGRLRELLRWGIPEPGGSGGSKGLPSSFLATVLLSTQSDVSAILSDSLQGDPTASGKDRIAAALQAVAQDPLFAALLRDTQARRDAAYTDKGARKTAKGSVFKDAADRLREARDEKERLQKLVDDSEGVEQQLRDLNGRRDARESALASAAGHAKRIEQLSAQAAAVAVADEQVHREGVEVTRIRQLGTDAETAERAVGALALGMHDAGQALQAAQEGLATAASAFQAADEAAKAAGRDSTTTETVVRQGLELRRAAVDQASREARQRIDRALAAQQLVDAGQAAAAEHLKRQAGVERARAALADATSEEDAAAARLRRLDVLGLALECRAADVAVSTAQGDVDREVSLRARLEAGVGELGAMVSRRAGMPVPDVAALAPMRQLANDLAGARGALNVGLVVTVTPRRALEIRVHRDGASADVSVVHEPLEIEADAAVDIDLDTATVQIRAGRAQAQRTMRSLQRRWQRDVGPYLAAAGVQDLDALSGRVEEARALDASTAALGAALEALRGQLASLAGAVTFRDHTAARATAAREALGGTSIGSLAADLAALGQDPAATIRKRRQQVAAQAEAARRTAVEAGSQHSVAEERTRSSKAVLEAAFLTRDAALTGFPAGVEATLSAARASLAATQAEEQQVGDEIAALDSTIAAEQARIAAAVGDTRDAEERARAAVDAAQHSLTNAVAQHAAQAGRLEELCRQRDAQDPSAAEQRLQEAIGRRAALPAPDLIVTEDDVAATRNAEMRARSELERIVYDIQRTHGALEQVGGAVARERLRDALEAFESAERREREVEDEYEAWLLLLQQMKEADEAQASNLGQLLAPAIAGRFEDLTRHRYEHVRLDAQLATEGVVVGGALRSTERMSVGTREQLSTLYRLLLAEHLKTCVVLDDQLVQSDAPRMDWFRGLLADKARGFQIIVFTCRERDYLPPNAIVPKGQSMWKDSDGGFTRAVDLERAIQRR